MESKRQQTQMEMETKRRLVEQRVYGGRRCGWAQAECETPSFVHEIGSSPQERQGTASAFSARWQSYSNELKERNMRAAMKKPMHYRSLSSGGARSAYLHITCGKQQHSVLWALRKQFERLCTMADVDDQHKCVQAREWLRSLHARLLDGDSDGDGGANKTTEEEVNALFAHHISPVEMVLDIALSVTDWNALDETCRAVQLCVQNVVVRGHTHTCLDCDEHADERICNYTFTLLCARQAHARLARLLAPPDALLDATQICLLGTCLLDEALTDQLPRGPWHCYDEERVQYVRQLLEQHDVSKCNLKILVQRLIPLPLVSPVGTQEVQNKKTMARLLFLHGAPRLKEWVDNLRMELYDRLWRPLIDVLSNPVMATADAVWADVVHDIVLVIDLLRGCNAQLLCNSLIVARIAHCLWCMNNCDKYLRNAHTWTDTEGPLRTLEDFEVMACDIIKDRHLTVAQVMQCVDCKPKMQSRLPPHNSKCECSGTDVSLSPPNKRVRLQ